MGNASPSAGKALARRNDAAPQPKTRPSSLPDSVARALADPPEVTVERNGVMVPMPGAWEPPSWPIFPEHLSTAREALDAMLAPIGVENVWEALTSLALTTKVAATEGMSNETAARYMREVGVEYARHLGAVPRDILKAATDACAIESEFWPTLAELFRHIKPELEKRRRMSERLDAIIKRAAQPAAARKPFEPEPEHVRLLHLLKLYETPGGMLYSPAKAEKTRARLRELGVDAPEAPQ